MSTLKQTPQKTGQPVPETNRSPEYQRTIKELRHFRQTLRENAQPTGLLDKVVRFNTTMP